MGFDGPGLYVLRIYQAISGSDSRRAAHGRGLPGLGPAHPSVAGLSSRPPKLFSMIGVACQKRLGAIDGLCDDHLDESVGEGQIR